MDETTTVKEVKAKRSKGIIVLNVFLIFCAVAMLFVAGVIAFQKAYLSPFWVNGQSMYPTLNTEAIKENGEKYGINGGSTQVGAKNVDYGVMDKHEPAIRNLRRFNIVVCKYSEKDTSDKIKRVIGLPGETIKFGQDADNGKLYVKSGDEFTFVEQPIANEYVVAGTYPAGEITLGDDEYYVVGDNRANSYDSTSDGVGPIKRSWIVGKAVAICGKCEIRKTPDNELEPYNVSFHSPRFI